MSTVRGYLPSVVRREGRFCAAFAASRDRAHRSTGRGALNTGRNAAPEEVHPRYRQSQCIKAPALVTLKTSLTLWPLDLSTLQPLHLASGRGVGILLRNRLAQLLGANPHPYSHLLARAVSRGTRHRRSLPQQLKAWFQSPTSPLDCNEAFGSRQRRIAPSPAVIWAELQ